MNLHMYWRNPEKTIIQIDLHPGWTWHELKAASTPYLEMMESVQHKVHLFMVVEENRVPPNALANINSLLRITHPREGRLVIVGNVPLITPLLKILSRVYGLSFLVQNIATVNTIEEAVAIIDAATARESSLPADG